MYIPRERSPFNRLMNIPIFEILILLFILFPFIKQLIEQLKGEQPQQPPQKHRETVRREQDPWENPDQYDWGGEQAEQKKPDWEDAFRELEEIFTGKRQEPRSKPKPEPQRAEQSRSSTEPARTSASTTTQHSEPIQLSDNPYQADMPDFQHVEHESLEIGASNPIYQERLGSKRDRAPSKAARSIRRTIQSPESLRAAFIFKEVLDKPGGRRMKYSKYS